MNSAPIRNALTIDVEDYFHVSTFAAHIARADWDRMPSRVDRNVNAILALLEEHGIQATFFMLGWVAEPHPGLARRIRALFGDFQWDRLDRVFLESTDEPARA